MRAALERIRNVNPAYLWPVLGIAAIVVLWTQVDARLSNERNNIRIGAFQHAMRVSNSYAEELTHTFNLYDQITLTTKFNWEKSKGLFRLEEYVKAGIYPSSKSLFVNIIDRNGQLTTSTLRFSKPVDYSNTDWFRNHKAGILTGLQIHGPMWDGLPGRKWYGFRAGLKPQMGSSTVSSGYPSSPFILQRITMKPT